jgi:hypothetical protein
MSGPSERNDLSLLQAKPSSGTLQKPQVKSCEDHDNSNIYDQPFPEATFEEQDIDSNDNRCHQHDVKHLSYLSSHFERPVPDYKAYWNV